MHPKSAPSYFLGESTHTSDYQMDIAGSPDIFQAKVSELMVTVKFVKTYLDDLLCITWASLDEHLETLREVLTRVRA